MTPRTLFEARHFQPLVSFTSTLLNPLPSTPSDNTRQDRGPSASLPLAALNFEIYEGDRILIRGPSGTGKTLFLRSLAGLHPWSGKAQFVFSAVGTRTSEPQMIYFSQKPVFVPGTVEDNLRLPFAFKKYAGHEFNPEKIQESLAAFGFQKNILQQSALSISGGEAQVIHLLRGLQLEPNLILLDEPTAALDAHRTLAIESFLRTWVNEKPYRAIMMVSHDNSQIDRFANQVWTLKNGIFHQEGLPKEKP